MARVAPVLSISMADHAERCSVFGLGTPRIPLAVLDRPLRDARGLQKVGKGPPREVEHCTRLVDIGILEVEQERTSQRGLRALTLSGQPSQFAVVVQRSQAALLELLKAADMSEHAQVENTEDTL